ncbi:hypothetical protein KKA53_04245 [Candidatus Dependentiae bacterium]|nr:hypothetical protein [Candidatus Dependentiae bacterium]
MKKLFLLIGSSFLVGGFVVGKSLFLVESHTSKRVSKNQLKENIGDELKGALHTCASIVDNLGKLQQEVASLQCRLLDRVEKLIENNRCFKKAKRKELHDALDIMDKIKKQLLVQEGTVKQLAAHMDKNICLKG